MPEICLAGIELDRNTAGRNELFFASLDELIAAAMEMSATRLVARIDEARIRIVDQHLGVEGLVDSFVDLLLGVSETELAAEFEIYLQCRHQPALRELAHSMMAGFEQSAASTLAALGVTEPSAARAFVALVDGFALQRFAWPRGREDRAALGDGLRAFLRAYVS